MKSYAHGILVQVDFGKKTRLRREQIEYYELKARKEAMNATEKYRGTVFDTRTEFDAGRFANKVSGNGVILGSIDQSKFKTALLEFRIQPFRQLLSFLDDPFTTWELDCNVVNGEYIPDIFREPVIAECKWDKFNLLKYYHLISSLYDTDDDYKSCRYFYSVVDDKPVLSAKTWNDAIANPKKYALVISDYQLKD